MSQETIGAVVFFQAISTMADVIETSKDYLGDLDSALGDGDHGVGMATAFRAVRAKLPAMEGKDIGTILKTTGMAIVSGAGGAMGPLYGTAFIRAGKISDGKTVVTTDDLVSMFQEARKGIIERGQGQVGEKTMLDTISPAVDAFASAVQEECSLLEALSRCEAAARSGMESTRDMISRRGRSSRLGERTLGHIDPGSASSYLLIQSFCNTLKEMLG
jgi:phosphoenolpyruvate---glycerone phosphotransferase subunit DhaL